MVQVSATDKSIFYSVEILSGVHSVHNRQIWHSHGIFSAITDGFHGETR